MERIKTSIRAIKNRYEHLPVFVYGTLMRGFNNYRLLEGRCDRETPAFIKGELYLVSAMGGFPCLLPGDQNISGTLMDIPSYCFSDVLADLDSLEGYRAEIDSGMYLRRADTVVTATGDVRDCWVYYWNSGNLGPRIESGSFAREMHMEVSPEIIVNSIGGDPIPEQIII
jgi:gamma-glutamylcyclotransferase (GGCT)/AIG2-like uncharacterized protein YtfP